MLLYLSVKQTRTKYAVIFRRSAKMLAKASMRNTNLKKYAGLFRRSPNVANRIRLRRATSNAHVFNKISYAGISKRSQRGGLENRLPKRHGGSNPSSCATLAPIFSGLFSTKRRMHSWLIPKLSL